MTIKTFESAIANTFNSNSTVRMAFGTVYGYRSEFELAVAQLGEIEESGRDAYLSVATVTVPMNATIRSAVYDAMMETYEAGQSGEADAIRADEDAMFASMAASMMDDPDFDMAAFS